MAATAETTDIPLDITQGLINRGIKEDCGSCPIALAFKEAAPGAGGVRVGSHGISFIAGLRHCVIRLPMAGQEFVQAFDNGPGEAEPCLFDVAIPSDLANLPGFLAVDETESSPVATWESPL